jgi:hypothetical protein
MTKKPVKMALIAMAAAALLSFVGCKEEGGGPSYIGNWEWVEGLTDGDQRQTFSFTETSWEMMMYLRAGGVWVAQFGFRGTYSGTADSWTITLTGVAIPQLYGNTWYGQTYWDFDYYYNLWYFYYYYFYYQAGGDNVMTIGYSLSADGNTLTMTIPGVGAMVLTRV